MKKILILAILFSLAGSFSSCKEKETDITKVNEITGKWELLKITISFTPEGAISRDYSQNNIVYEFKADGILTVSRDINHSDTYVHEQGDHFYSIIDDKEEYTLKIDNNLYWYSVSNNDLIIDQSPLDGFTYYFVKLKN